MMKRIKARRSRRLLAMTLVCLLSWAGTPLRAWGQEESEIPNDARLEGYGEKVVLDSSNATMTWLGFGFFSAVALLALFKDAKRSHLD